MNNNKIGLVRSFIRALFVYRITRIVLEMKRISNFEAQLKNEGLNERLWRRGKKEKEENIVKNEKMIFDNFERVF